jgi:hypothetical protein
MAILTKSGRIVIAESVMARAIHLAWGTGDGAWNVPPSEDPDADTLIAEVGRRQATELAYVVADDEGDIVLPGQNYLRSETPTNSLLVRTQFDFTDAAASVIREIAVYVGTVPVDGLPVGQRYFLPAEIAAQGRLLHLENIEPIFRSPAIRESFEVVISF